MATESQFKKYLLYSIVFHVVVFIVFLVLAEYSHRPVIPFTKITMLNLAPKLGTPKGAPEAPPGLPPEEKKIEEIKPEEIKPVPPKPEAKPKVEKKVPPPPKTTKKKTPPPKKTPKAPPKSRITRKVPQPPTPRTRKVEAPDENAMAAALGKIDQEVEDRERQLSQPPPATTSTHPDGGLGTPEGTIVARGAEYNQYKSRVRSKIIRNWVKTHAGTQTQKLSATVKVRINASGAVISKSLIRRSGDSSFDNSALRAVERASPLPPPPPSAKDEAIREGFVVSFRARVIAN